MIMYFSSYHDLFPSLRAFLAPANPIQSPRFEDINDSFVVGKPNFVCFTLLENRVSSGELRPGFDLDA